MIPRDSELFPLLTDELGREMRGQDFLSLHDFMPDQVERFVEVTLALKRMKKERRPHPVLEGKSLAMIFNKASTRTRVSFEVGMYQLGGQALNLNTNEMQLGRGESLPDTAQVLSRYVDGIVVRTYAHEDLHTLADSARVPVINGLTDLLHPTQAVADFATIAEYRGRCGGCKLVYVGDGNNMAHSLMYGAAKLGIHMVVCTPDAYRPDADVLRLAQADAEEYGTKIEWSEDPAEAVEEANVIYTDTWTSMGQEEEAAARTEAFAAYQVNRKLVERARSDVLIMHCLPAHRGEEITDEVIDGPNSVVFDEAENRLHAHKAILSILLNSGK